MTGSGEHDYYAALEMFANFVYARYDFDQGPCFWDGKGVEAKYWVWKDTLTLVGPSREILEDTATSKSEFPGVVLDRRYSQSCPPWMAGLFIDYNLEIRASVDSTIGGEDTLAFVSLLMFPENDRIVELPLGCITGRYVKRNRSWCYAVFSFTLPQMGLGYDLDNSSVKAQVVLKIKNKRRFRVSFIKIYDQRGYTLVESRDYLEGTMAYLPIEYEIDGVMTAVYPRPEYRAAYMMINGEFEEYLLDYRSGQRIKLRSSDF
jgi:hypothetical protein